jgi:hypothetical protein
MSENKKTSSPITIELNSISRNGVGHVLSSRDEVEKLADQTQLVLFLNALSGRARILDRATYSFLHQRYQRGINSYIGGLTRAAYAGFYCAEIDEAAKYHREHFAPAAKRLPQTKGE